MIAVLVGTRPELIKMAPVIRRLDDNEIQNVFIHSNQHYSKNLSADIIKDLNMKSPDYNLNVGSDTHAVQTGKIMEGVERICMKVKPDVLVVHGDTNTTLGGALSAKKLHIKVAHVEAGLRSFDYRMPEEINRILTDRISDVLFAPTKIAADNLLKEGIDEKTVNITGNTIVDALNDHIKIARKKDYLKDFELKKNDYIIATCHRPENVDDPNRLKKLSSILQHATGVVGKKMILPLHPRTKNQLDKNGIELHESIIVKPPVGYLQMLALLDAASLVITDSGGIQEEAYLLKRPLITIRNSTERPETLSANFIIDLDKGKFDEAWDRFEKKKVTWDNSFGDGKASGRIVNALNKVVKD